VALVSGYDAFISYSHRHDGVLGPVLQADLERFAKPWHRMRAMRVFRDAANLSASPALWASIEDALRSSRWFILLASADAASSAWVNREVQWWRANRSLERLLVVGTSRGLAWDRDKQDWAAGAPVPPALRGAFAGEPLWVDLSDVQLDHRKPRVPTDLVASVAAPIRGVSKDMIVGEHLRLYRRTMRLARSAVAVLAILTALAIVASFIAVTQRNSARAQTRLAIHELDVAVSGQLINQSETLGDRNATVSRLESIAAWDLNPSAQARYAMLSDAASPEVATFTDPDSAEITSIKFSPDGKILATGDQNGVVRLRDMTTDQPVGSPLVSGRYSVGMIAFSPDSQTVATGDLGDGAVRLWNADNQRQSKEPLTTGTNTGADGVAAMALSPDGKVLATGNGGATCSGPHSRVRLWDTTSRKQIGTPLDSGPCSTTSLAFSPDGRTLAAGGNDATVRLWDMATYQLTGELAAITQGSGQVTSVAFAPGGRILASAGDGGIIRLWDVATSQQIGAPIAASTIQIESLAFGPNGATLADSGYNGQVQVWDVATHRQIETFSDATNSPEVVAFSPDGKTLATGDNSGTVRLWNVAASGERINIAAARGTGSGFIVTFSPDGKMTAIGANDGTTVQLWDVATRRRIGAPILAARHGIYHGLATMMFSPDGKTLATADGTGVVRMWDVATRQQAGTALTTISGNDDVWLAFTPDGKTLADRGSDGNVWLWDLATHRRIGNRLNVQAATVAFSPSGKILATDDGDGTVQLWDVATRQQIGKPLATAAVPEIFAMAFSPDSKTLAVTNGNGGVQLWDVASHQHMGTALTANSDPVSSVTFSPDGKTLALVGAGHLRLWDIATRQQIGAPLAVGDIGITPTTWVIFSSGGNTLAEGSENGTVTLWNVSYLTHVLPQLCSQIGGSFTAAEWALYMPAGMPYRQVCP